jgi:hypothetical protein
LHTVFNRYHITSLPELNAVLRLYNVMADRGKKESRIYQNGGLRVLNDWGNKVGVPIKASAISFQPTIKFLEGKFKEGEEGHALHKRKLKAAIDFVLYQKTTSLEEFMIRLKEEKITTVLRKNENGFVYGVTFIDHRTGAVFNGSDLGKGYSAAALRDRITRETGQHNIAHKLLSKTAPEDINASTNKGHFKAESRNLSEPLRDLLKPLRQLLQVPS